MGMRQILAMISQIAASVIRLRRFVNDGAGVMLRARARPRNTD